METVVKKFINRWDQMIDLYPKEYVLQFFHVYEDEMEAVVKALKSKQMKQKRRTQNVHRGRQQR